MNRRRQLQTALFWAAVAWIVLASAVVTRTFSRRTDNLLIPLGIPLVIGTLAALARQFRLRVAVSILIALFCLWNAAAMFSIGWLFLPATLAFVAALTWIFAEP
jgi:hypothetical protein